MPVSKETLCQLIESLPENQNERPCLDAKAIIHFNEPGDKANFIKMIVAMANNAEISHILVGIEDKTWKKIGIDSLDHMIDSDEAERQMNQYLQKKVDPLIAVEYQVHEIDGKKIGVITIDASFGPHIIEEDLGGKRTRAKGCWIHKGQIYYRHGTTIKIVNRKEELLRLIEKFNPNEGKWYENYYEELDLKSEVFYDKEEHKNLIICLDPFNKKCTTADSWVLLSLIPEKMVNLNLPELRSKLMPGNRIGRGNKFRRIPKQISDMLFTSKVSPARLRARDTNTLSDIQEGSYGNLDIMRSGIIEFNLTHPIYLIEQGNRYFNFVYLVGYLWQMIYLSKAIYEEEGYKDNIKVILKLINTKGTTLQGFARGWGDAFTFLKPDFSRYTHVCEDPHIQLEDNIDLRNASDQNIENIVRGLAKEIGLYYDMDMEENPKCFQRVSKEFPWDDFVGHTS